jgi:ribosomal protein S18 acetylase RimI-like enzyme
VVELVETVPSREELLSLYEANEWRAYTIDPDGLHRGVGNSTYVVAAREEGALVGLARVVSDDHTIMYLQDILVLPTHQRQGIGRSLLERCLDRFAHCRQKVLMTDDEERQIRFYESLGFVRSTEVPHLTVFVEGRAT